MKFTASQLSVIRKAAVSLRAPWENLGAVVEVESAGVIDTLVNGKRLPVIRYEGHYVYRRLSGAARTAAVKEGLAAKSAGGVKNPASQTARYALLERCVALCKRFGVSLDIGYESCSWGIGQVMGANWKDLGYKSCRAFVADVCSGFDGQLRVMVAFIVFNKIDDELRDGRFAGFARVYNGPSYRKNRYDTKMIAAAKRLKLLDNAVSDEPLVVPTADGMLRLGSKGRRVRELQALLVAAGATIRVDGDFGPATRDAVKAFQGTAKLRVDGVYGPATEAALAAFRPVDQKTPGHQNVTDLVEVKTAVTAGGGAVAAIVAAKQALEEGASGLTPYIGLPWVEHVQSALAVGAVLAGVVAVAYGLYGWWDSKRTDEV